jgi:ureidoglycolate lyase
MNIIIKPKKITKKKFSKFGEVIDAKKRRPLIINNGYAKRFHDLGKINTSLKKGNPIISIFSAKKRRFPMKINMMEKHPLGSQAFIPMKETIFLVLVAPRGKKPTINKIQSFIVPKQTGINYKPGIWHFPLISNKNMNFLVIDRKGKGNNLIVHNFKKEKILLKK